MAIKTWSSGEVLTASDLNTYAGNPGLVYVTQVTIGTAVSSVVVSNAFSSVAFSYRIVISNVQMSSTAGTTNMWLRMHDGTNAAASNYNYGIARVDLATGAVSGIAAALGTNGMFLGTGTGDLFGTAIDIVNPNLASHTIFPVISQSQVSTGYSGSGAGMHQTSTAYTGFDVRPSTGTMTGGIITVYSYRKA